WLGSFLYPQTPAGFAPGRGAGPIGRGQLAPSSDPALAGSLAGGGVEMCPTPRGGLWDAPRLSPPAGGAPPPRPGGAATARADEALAMARAAGDGWNEGYALGVKAAIAGVNGSLREAQDLAKASIDVMRRIDQQWGTARALLGLGDLARLRGDPGDARRHYLE